MHKLDRNSRPVPNLSGSAAMSRVDGTSADQSEMASNMSDITIFTPPGATIAPYMQGEESVRDPSWTIDPTKLGARPKTPKAPISEEKEEDDLSEKVTTKDLVTGGTESGPSVTETRGTTEAEVHPDEAAQLEAEVNAEFVAYMTKAAKAFVSSKEAWHLKVLKEVTFSPIEKRGGTPGLSSTGNSELTSSSLSIKSKSTPDLSTSNEASVTLGENLINIRP